MNNVFENSFLPTAVTALSESNVRDAGIAQMVLKADGDTILDQICAATGKLVSQRRVFKAMDETDNGERAKSMDIKPEHVLLSFLQSVLNKSCWIARRQYIANEQAEADERLNGGTGRDWSQDVSEEMGLNPQSNRELADRIEMDFLLMLRLQSYLTKSFTYLSDLEDLHLYADRGPVVDEDTGEVMEDAPWELKHSADDWHSALHTMTEIVNDLNEQSDALALDQLMNPTQNWAEGIIEADGEVPMEQPAAVKKQIEPLDVETVAMPDES